MSINLNRISRHNTINKKSADLNISIINDLNDSNITSSSLDVNSTKAKEIVKTKTKKVNKKITLSSIVQDFQNAKKILNTMIKGYKK